MLANDSSDVVPSSRSKRSRALSEEPCPSRKSSLFRVDATGGAQLSRSVRRDVKKLEKNVANISAHHISSLAHYQKALPRRQKTFESIENKRKAIQKVYDVWDSPQPNIKPRLKAVQRGRQSTIRAPAVCLPLPGQSVNPDPSQHRDIVLSAAAVTMEQDRKKEEFERRLNPVTSYLLDVLPEQLVESLDSIQKQKAYAYLVKLPSLDEDSIGECVRLIQERASQQEAAPTTDLGANASEDESHESDAATSYIRQPMKGKKSRTARNRFERHCRELKEAACRRQEKKFLSCIEHITTYLAEIEESKARREAVAVYKQSMKEARDAAHTDGVSIQYKCGRYHFVEGPVDVLLPSTLEETNGSLRRLRLAEVPAAAIKDRVGSIYRRKLLEPSAAGRVTPRVLAKARRLAHWKLRARKTRIKL